MIAHTNNTASRNKSQAAIEYKLENETAEAREEWGRVVVNVACDELCARELINVSARTTCFFVNV